MSDQSLTKIIKRNWWIDFLLEISGIFTILSGVVFLTVPRGGYRGGRNPYEGMVSLFDRSSLENLHIWSSLALISLIFIHVILHWNWVKNFFKRINKESTGQYVTGNQHDHWKMALNLLVAVLFAATAISGIALFFLPHRQGSFGIDLIFSRTTWVLIHTWTGILFSLGLATHIAIHWRWVITVTRRMASGIIAPASHLMHKRVPE